MIALVGGREWFVVGRNLDIESIFNVSDGHLIVEQDFFGSLASPALSKKGFGVEGNLGGSAGRVALQVALSGPERAQGGDVAAGAEMGSGEKKITLTRVCH